MASFDPIADALPAVRVSRCDHERAIYQAGYADGRAAASGRLLGALRTEARILSRLLRRDVLGLALFVAGVTCAFVLVGRYG